jgi:Anti-sigma-K factor rskA
LLTIASIVGFGLYFYSQSQLNFIQSQSEIDKIKCDSLSRLQADQFAIIQQINATDNKIINLAASTQFAETDLYLHYNSTTKKNILQVINAPTLKEGQAFQLWALKDGEAPEPMEVFDAKNSFVSVGFVDDAKTYAITIEPAGGSLSPTLTNLIGTMTVE